MILEAMALIAAAVGTVVIGAPIASRLAQPSSFGRTAPREKHARQRTEVTSAFRPLDLGPDPIKWPSERPWSLDSTLKVPEWPSKSWNDENFGRHWRDGTVRDVADRGFHAMAARRTAENKPTPQPKPEPRKSSKSATKAAKSTESASPRKRQQTANAARKAAEQAQDITAEASFFVEEGATQSQAAETRSGVPSAAELEHLIATIGLAGTVQAIMQRTGWDFREAAQYLAKSRQKG